MSGGGERGTRPPAADGAYRHPECLRGATSTPVASGSSAATTTTAAAPWCPRHRRLRRLSAGDARPGRPALRPPVHHLHQLRPRYTVITDLPTTDRPPRRWAASDVRGLRRRVRRPTGATTHRPSPAPTAGRGCPGPARRIPGSPRRCPPTRPGIRSARRARHCWPGGWSRSRASAASTSPAVPTTPTSESPHAKEQARQTLCGDGRRLDAARAMVAVSGSGGGGADAAHRADRAAAADRRAVFSDAVAPALADLGVMLAYSPVHHQIFDRLGARALGDDLG